MYDKMVKNFTIPQSFDSQFQEFQLQLNFNSNSGIGTGIELQFQFQTELTQTLPA